MKKASYKDLTWVEIQKPEQSDLEYLKGQWDVHSLIIEELQPPSYRSRVERFDHSLYLVVYFPVFHKDKKYTKTRELDIIVGQDFLITSHYRSILPLKEIFDKCNLYQESRDKYMGNGAGYLLYSILENMLRHCLPKIEHIAENIDQAEEQIFNGQERKMVARLSVIKRDVLNMGKAIHPQESVIKSLDSAVPEFFGSQYKIYFQDLLGSYQQVRSALDSHQKILSSLCDTNESLLSNKVSEIMKVLTIVSFVTFPLTVIVSIFGMNVFAQWEFVNAVWLLPTILSTMIICATVMIIIFKKKNWL